MRNDSFPVPEDYKEQLFRLYGKILEKYAGKGAILDTNVLLVYLVGTVDPKLIPSFRRTQAYLPEDYYCLHDLVQHFGKIILTPNILTEACNLLRSGSTKLGKREFKDLFLGVLRCQRKEWYIDSESAVVDKLFEKVGLTDTVICLLSGWGYPVITADLDLFEVLERKNRDAINYNHLRPYL